VVPETELPTEIRKTGHRMADMTVAFSALFVSLCSLGIAVHHGHTMQKLVEANSRPLIQFSISTGELTAGVATSALIVLISNPGAGAARVEKFSMLLDGRPVKSVKAALLELAGDPAAVLGGMLQSDIAPSYVKANSEVTVLRWPRTDSNAAVWDKVMSVDPGRVKFEACYCSIFDECWIEDSNAFKPRAVTDCA
jgi:hypothetical protein